MDNSVLQIIIVLISSGALGTLITALSKKKERQNSDNIKIIVSSQTKALQDCVDKLSQNQVRLAEALKEISNKVDNLSIKQKVLHNNIEDIKKESEEMDLLFIEKLREKHIFNGESTEFYKYLLKQKDNRLEKEKIEKMEKELKKNIEES